ERLVCVPNGVADIEEKKRASQSVKVPVIVSVARFQEPKDFRTLIKGLSMLTELQWRLVLVGDGPDESLVKALVESSGLSDRTTFTGLVRNVPDVLAKAQIFVLSSRSEGLPLSV